MGRRILMDAGYEVVTVNNGSAALKKIHESHPDLIVLDVYMPGYGGLEVCQRLKDSADTARIPVLLSVGKMEPFKADEAKRVRADGHIVKPFEASELLAALTRLEDRIVPQGDSASGRRGKSESGQFETAKSEKKSHLWKAEDPLASAKEPLTDRVAYLSEAKKRRAHTEEANEEAGVATRQEVAAASSDPAVPAVEFAVQPSAAPPGSGDGSARPAMQAAEAPVEAPSIFDAPTIEIPAAQLSITQPSEAEVSAEVAAPAAKAAAKADDSQEWVLGKSLFGKPVHGEPELSESVFEKTAFYQTAFGKSEAREGQAASEDAPIGAVAASALNATRWIAENVALSVEEASIALEAEMQQAQAVSAVAATEAEIPAPVEAASPDQALAQAASLQTETENASGAAFAAVAAAGHVAGTSFQHSTSGIRPAPDVAETTSAAPEVEPPVVSDATAAWANWQQIRESVMSPQQAAEIAESVAAIAQASLPAQESAAAEDVAAKPDSASSEKASAAPAAEDNSINDIVDSVLADLKPRLMQEIAKKLAAKK